VPGAGAGAQVQALLSRAGDHYRGPAPPPRGRSGRKERGRGRAGRGIEGKGDGRGPEGEGGGGGSAAMPRLCCCSCSPPSFILLLLLARSSVFVSLSKMALLAREKRMCSLSPLVCLLGLQLPQASRVAPVFECCSLLCSLQHGGGGGCVFTNSPSIECSVLNALAREAGGREECTSGRRENLHLMLIAQANAFGKRRALSRYG
jgi:hypothetical protein